MHAHESQDLRGGRATALLLIRDSQAATRSRPSFYRKGSMEPSRELLTNAAEHGADERGPVIIKVGLNQRPGEIELYGARPRIRIQL